MKIGAGIIDLYASSNLVYLVVIDDEYLRRLLIVDISDPKNPEIVSNLPLGKNIESIEPCCKIEHRV